MKTGVIIDHQIVLTVRRKGGTQVWKIVSITHHKVKGDTQVFKTIVLTRHKGVLGFQNNFNNAPLDGYPS